MSDENSTTDKNIDCDVLIVGAGFSGVAALYRMRDLGLKAKIFESGSDFGGVWYWNRYPGARVDSEWPYYQLNIPEVYRKFDFNERFSDHREIRQYFTHLDNILGLRKDVCFGAHVNGATWDDAEGKWTIKTEQGHTAKAKYLILCSGLLHRRHYPDFPGLDSFKGAIHHSGFWPEELSTKGKKVALIGAGATAVQITQEVAKEADHLTIFMRRPSLCLPMGQRKIYADESNQHKTYYPILFSEGRKSNAGFPAKGMPVGVFDVSDEEFEQHCEDQWSRGAFNFFLRAYADVLANPEANKCVYKFWAKKMRARMTDPKKRDLMAPPVEKMPYYFGTKRPPLEQDYYEMVDRDNVDVVNMNETPLKTFTEKGMQLEDGTELDFDIVILATGFDSFSGSLTQMGVKSRDGQDIKDYWADGIRTYLGMMFAGYPNAFMIYTPHAPTALSNGPTIIEMQADFVTTTIKKLESENGRSVEPTSAAEDEWSSMIEAQNKPTLFPFTNSWWTGANIPGKKVQMLTYILGIVTYEPECLAKLEGWKGFEVKYNEGGKKEVEMQLPDRTKESEAAADAEGAPQVVG